jgi:hypothetical protein
MYSTPLCLYITNTGASHTVTTTVHASTLQEKQRSTDASGISYAALNQSVKRLTASNKNLVTENARAALEIKKYTDILKVC